MRGNVFHCAGKAHVDLLILRLESEYKKESGILSLNLRRSDAIWLWFGTYQLSFASRIRNVPSLSRSELCLIKIILGRETPSSSTIVSPENIVFFFVQGILVQWRKRLCPFSLNFFFSDIFLHFSFCQIFKSHLSERLIHVQQVDCVFTPFK